MYHKVSYDHNHHVDSEALGGSGHLHAVPHCLDPLAAQHPEHDKEGVEEVVHVPAGQLAGVRDLAHTVFVLLSK